MIRTIEDFVSDYSWERQTTSKVLHALTDASLSRCKTEGDQSICDIAWHVATVGEYLITPTGLPFSPPAKPETFTAQYIADAYDKASQEIIDAVKSNWKDEDLHTVNKLFGMDWPNGVTLGALIHHEIHHRGQLSILMRQEGLTVPNIYGPNKEETAEWLAKAAAAQGETVAAE
jgi:uncharacterized damage-inducible protein DinB